MISVLTILGWLAWGGGIALAFQLILEIFGFGSTNADVSVDSGDISDGSVDSADDSSTDTDGGGIKVFSLLGISSFLFIFGIVGRYCIISFQLHWAISLLIAFVIGILVMYVIGWLFYKAKSLESNGTTRIDDSLGCTGTVYLPMNKNNEKGVVQVNVNGIMREYDSLSLYGEALNVGDKVVVKEITGNLVKVVKNN